MKTTIGNYRCGKSIGQDILEKKIAAQELFEYFSPADQSFLECGAFRRFGGSLLQCLIN
jgi:hypothetical protein